MPPSRTVVSVYGVAPSRIGGTEIFIRELSLRLQKHGCKNVVCFLSPPKDEVRAFLDLPNIAIEVIPDSWRLKVKPTRDLARVLRHYRPEILHLQYTGFLGFYPWLAKLHGVKQVYFTDQASNPEGFIPRQAPLWKRLATRAINYPVNRVTCISDYVRNCWIELNVLPADRFTRIYNFVSPAPPATDGTAFRARFGIPADAKVVLQISWIIPEKGISDLLAAARIVLAQEHRAHLVIVGEGEQRPGFMREASELGLEGHITWTGRLMNPMKEGAYAAADVVCQTSRWEEAFGYVIAEAMMSGKPLVGTRVGGIPELIADGKSGFVVERRDSEAIADRLLRLLRDPALARKMGETGRAIAMRDFSVDANIGKFLTLYGLPMA